MTEECCVCFLNYNTDEFKIVCDHSLCKDCYLKLPKNICPICREKIKVKRYKKKKTPKGKINLDKYKKIKTHLTYKYNLHTGEKRVNKNRQQKMGLLQVLYPIFEGE